MKRKKKKYTPPLVHDLSGTTIRGAQAFNCKSGHAAGQLCDFGAVAGGQCRDGGTATLGCSTGAQYFPTPKQCKDGMMATLSCWDGNAAFGKCKSGYGVM